MNDLAELQHRARGDRRDYVFGTALGWDAFDVARFTGREAIGQTYAFSITLVRARDRALVAPSELLLHPATLQIATEARFRPVHGLITSAEEIDRSPTMQILRVLLEPRWALARHRVRHRTFVDRTLFAILCEVLEHRDPEGVRQPGAIDALAGEVDPPGASPSWTDFTAPRAMYRFAVVDRARLDHRDLRRHVVQYGESDLDFVARLLEEEGLSMVFEQADGAEILTITDAPGKAPLFPRDEHVPWRSGARLGTSRDQEVVRNLRRGARVHPDRVTVRDFDFERSHTTLQRTASNGDGHAGLSIFAYPGRDEAMAVPGDHPARVTLGRRSSAAAAVEGWGTMRILEPGRRVSVQDVDISGEEEALLVTAIETHAVELPLDGTELDREPFAALSGGRATTGYVARFEAVPVDVHYRPPRRAHPPRIWGVQPAKVTAEELPRWSRPEIHCDRHGRVRLRFPWDQRTDRDDGTPSSGWARVSQVWAGTGFGGMFVPRLGQEVLVAFEQGDPERPIVVGRVYDAENPLPYELPANKTVSTVKSQSSPAADGFNEFRFEDQAGEEQVFLHAQRNLDEVVVASHSTSVGGDQTNGVGGKQRNTVGASRWHDIGADERIHVAGDQHTQIGSNETHSTGGFRTTEIGASDKLTVAAFRQSQIGANDDLRVTGWRNTSVGTGENRSVAGPDKLVVTGGRDVDVTGTHAMVASGAHTFASPAWKAQGATAELDMSASFVVQAGGCQLRMEAGVVSITNGAGASLSLVGGLVLVSGAATIQALAPTIGLAGSSGVNVASGGNVDVVGAKIKLNG